MSKAFRLVRSPTMVRLFVHETEDEWSVIINDNTHGLLPLVCVCVCMYADPSVCVCVCVSTSTRRIRI